MMSRTFLFAASLALAAAGTDVTYRSGCSMSVKGCEGTEVSCVNGELDLETGICTFYDTSLGQCYTCVEQAGYDKCECVQPASSVIVVDDEGTELTSTLTCNRAATVGGSSSSSSLPPTTSNSGTTMTIGTYNGMYGWLDIDPSRFYGFSEFLLGLVATIPSFYTKAGFNVVYDCSASGLYSSMPSDFEGCNIFLFHYRCPPCDSRAGDLGSYLLSYDQDDVKFYAGNCGPTFKLNKDLGEHHQFAVYSAEMGAGRVKLTLPNHVEFMFWALVGKSVVCQAKDTEAECGDYPINCMWADDMCKPRVCPPPSPFQGPNSPRCQVCVDDEADFIPEVTDV